MTRQLSIYVKNLSEYIEISRGETLGDFVQPYTEDQVYQLPDEGNGPQFAYILRTAAWQEPQM